MTANKSYNHFVNNVFGHGTLVLDEHSDNENKIIEEIDYCHRTGTSSFFTSNLQARFSRLHKNFSSDPIKLAHIISKIRNLSETNWMGYYSELVAYDFFSLLTPIEIEISLSLDETFAQYLPNRQASSLDGSLNHCSDICFEVKCFSDVVKAILENITDRLIRKGLFKNITCDYPNDLDPSRLHNIISSISQELVEASKNKSLVYSHQELPELQFRLFYTGQRIYFTENSYEPYRHAESLRYFILNHFDQFQINNPNLLVYIVHPWFNLILNDFGNSKQVFFRALCRRVFCQLTKDSSRICDIMPKKFPKVTLEVREIVRKLTHILFIVDNNVEPQKALNSNDLLTVMEGYLFNNPNVDNANQSMLIDDLLTLDYSSKLIRSIESFENDNY